MTPFIRLSELSPEQCKKVYQGKNETETFVRCKAELGKKLLEKCEGTKIKDAGTLYYCKIRTERTCCFRFHRLSCHFLLSDRLTSTYCRSS